MGNRGRNINTIDNVSTTTVEVNSLTATTLLSANPKRISATISLDFSNGADEEVLIREFAASIDPTLNAGELLSRVTLGNTNAMRLVYKTDIDNPHIGEISAITGSGTFDVHVIERTI